MAGKKLNLRVLILSTSIIDIEVLILGIQTGFFNNHGIMHTFIGATIYGLGFGLLYFIIRFLIWQRDDWYYSEMKSYERWKKSRHHNWTLSVKCTLMSAVIGAYAHISLDWLFYEDAKVWPSPRPNFYYEFTQNHFAPTFYIVYLFLATTFILGMTIYLYRFSYDINKEYKVSSVYDISIRKKDLWTILGLISTPFAIAGINILILIRTANYPLILLSGGSILTMWIGYFFSLENINWKLIE